MKTAHCIFFIVYLITSSAHAGGWDDFARGFAEAEKKNAPIREARRYERDLHQSVYNDIVAQLQAYENQQAQQANEKLSFHINKFRQEDFPKCRPENTNPQNVNKISACLRKAMLNRYELGGYRYMHLVNNHAGNVKSLSSAYAKGKINADDYNQAITESAQSWTQEEQMLDAEYRTKINQAIHEIAQNKATAASAGSGEAYLQRRNIEELQERVEAAEASAKQAQWDAQAAEREASRLKVKVCGSYYGC